MGSELTPRHDTAALLARLGSPLFARLAESDETLFVKAETMPSLRRITKLRDESFDERVQLRAAQDIADRNPDTARVSRGRSSREHSVSTVLEEYVRRISAIDTTGFALPEPRLQPLADAIVEQALADAESGPW